MTSSLAPNHHAHHAPFSGLTGLLLGLRFAVGRTGVPAFAADIAGLDNGDAVIDIGCGPGNAARYAAAQGATSVLGVDPAPVMLRLGRLLTIGRRVTYRAGAAEAIPSDDNSATLVWSFAAVHHWADLGTALAEVRRVLRPGGRFVAIETEVTPGAHGHAYHGWNGEQADAFAQLCRDAGFTDLRIERRHADGRPRIAVVATRAT